MRVCKCVRARIERSELNNNGRRMLTAGIIGNEIAVLVKIMVGIQALVFRMDVVEVLAVENDTAQSSTRGQRHPRVGNISNATLVMTEFLQHFHAILAHVSKTHTSQKKKKLSPPSFSSPL